MKDQEPLNLATYRSAKNREQRNAALTRWKPSPALMAWAALIAFAAVTYVAFGSNNLTSTTDENGMTERSEPVEAQTLNALPSTNDVDTPAPTLK